MHIRQLQEIGGSSAGLTLPRDELEYLGLVDEEGRLVGEQQMKVRMESEEPPRWTIEPANAQD
jgi:hypothetical protein